jgi:hypothetical protein
MYELWHVVDNQPLFLLKREDKFDKIYEEFKIVSNTRPCVITRTEGPPSPTTGKENVFIYESPDNGKTIYKRKFGEYENKTLVKTDDLN